VKVAVAEPLPLREEEALPTAELEEEEIAEEEIAATFTQEDLEALFEQAPEELASEDAEEFWETASEESTGAGSTIDPDVLTFDQALQLGLTPDEAS